MLREKLDHSVLIKHLKKNRISVDFTESFLNKFNKIMSRETQDSASVIRRKIFSIIYRMNYYKEKKNTK